MARRPARLKTRHIVGLSIGLLATAAAAHLGLWSRAWRRNFDRWLVDTPASIDADLSEPCTLTFPFTQTCDVAHAQRLLLVTPSGEDSKPLPERAIRDLWGSVRVTGDDGAAADYPIPHQSVGHSTRTDEGLLLARGWFGPNGPRTVTVEITSGAPLLAGTPQRLIIRNELCGCELLPAALGAGLAFASGTLGAAILLPTLVSVAAHTRARRRWLREASPPPAAEAGSDAGHAGS